MRPPRFRAYRTYECLEHAMVWYCDAVLTHNGMRGCCIMPDCPGRGARTLRCGKRAPVAYCGACHRTFDALSLVCNATDCDLWAAAKALGHVATEA